MDVGDIEYKTLRNKDFKEYTLELNGEALLKFAAAYGSRNIQVSLFADATARLFGGSGASLLELFCSLKRKSNCQMVIA